MAMVVLKNKNQINHSQHDEKRAFSIQNRRYLGAKTKLLPLIEAVKGNGAILAAGETTVTLQKKVVSSK